MFCDNSGALNVVLGGAAGATASDFNTIVGKLWLQLVADDTEISIARVPSKANIADGSTRFVSSTQVAAMSPQWLDDFWSGFGTPKAGSQ